MNSYKVVIDKSKMIDVVLGETTTEAVENWFKVNKQTIRECLDNKKRYALSVEGKGIVTECDASSYDEAVETLMNDYGLDIQEVEK